MKANYRYENERKTKFTKGVQELIEYILNLNYGDIITIEICEKYLQVPYNYDLYSRTQFRNLMKKIKDFLVNYGYILKLIVGVGYYILKPKQISGHCYHTYMLRCNRLLEKSERILTHIDKTELNDIRLKEYNEYKKLNDDLEKNTYNTIIMSNYYKNKDYYNELQD